MAYHLSRLDEAEEFYERSMAIRERLGDQHGIALNLNNLGAVAEHRGDYPHARECHLRSLAIHERIGNQAGMGLSWANLGVVAEQLDDYARAEECQHRSLVIRERIGDQWGMGQCWHNLGVLAGLQDATEHAEEYVNRSLVICERIGDREGSASCLVKLAHAAINQGHYRRAEEYALRGLTICEQISDSFGLCEILDELAVLAELRGALDQAEEYLLRGLRVREQIHDRKGLVLSWTRLGALLGVRGDHGATGRPFAPIPYRQARRLAQELGHPNGEALAALGSAVAHLRRARAFPMGPAHLHCRRLQVVAAYSRHTQTLLSTFRLAKVTVPATLLEAELLFQQGDMEHARHLAEEALALATTRLRWPDVARARRLLGMCALACGILDESEAQLRDAEEHFEQTGAVLELARTRAVLAELLHARAAVSPPPESTPHDAAAHSQLSRHELPSPRVARPGTSRRRPGSPLPGLRVLPNRWDDRRSSQGQDTYNQTFGSHSPYPPDQRWRLAAQCGMPASGAGRTRR